MPPSVPTFAELLAGTHESAVHLEMRDVYAVAEEDSDFAAWRATGISYELAERATWWTDFHAVIASAVERGVVVRRARVVSEPVTQYIRYEHSCTPQNLVAGEQVRWLPRQHASDIMLPGNDLWLFDRRLVRFGLFSGEGAFVGHELTADPAVARQCAASFETVWQRATPHENYLLT